MSSSRLSTLLLTCALLAACDDAPPATEAPCAGCDVLLISVDTLRPDHVGLYGYERPTTPRIDALFREHSVFTQATSTSSCTVPAVKQFLHGRFDPGDQSLARVLADAGYRTGAIASQHQFWHDEDVYAQGFQHWDLQSRDEVDHHDMAARRAEDVTDAALAWLDDDTEAPDFLWLHYFDPHDPYQPPPGATRFDDRDGGRLADGDRRAIQMPEGHRRGVPWYTVDDVFTPADRQRLTDLYDSEIRYVDDQIGRVVDALAERGRLEDTVVVLLSDHGERLGEGGLWDHCITVDEVEVRSPLLMRVPGHPDLFPPRVRGERTSTLDTLPTILDLVGIEHDEMQLDGRTLLSEGPRYALSTFRDEVAISRGPHKLYCEHTDEGACQIRAFTHVDATLQETPADRHNPAYTLLQAELAQRQDVRLRATDAAGDALGQLKALGYTKGRGGQGSSGRNAGSGAVESGRGPAPAQ